MNHRNKLLDAYKKDKGAASMIDDAKNLGLKPTAWVLIGLMYGSAQAHASGLDFGGTAYLTYDQTTWATLVDEALYVSSSAPSKPHLSPGSPRFNDGNLYPTADQSGSRYLYPQRFIDYRTHPNWVASLNISGASNGAIFGIGGYELDPEAVEQYRVYNEAERVPLAQPAGGFGMAVDSLAPGLDWGWANANGAESTLQLQNDQAAYDPVSNPISSAYIQLGASMRLLSDFNNPESSLQFTDIYVSNVDGNWFLGGYGYSAFELINPQIGINPNNGKLSLEADYRWGNTDWSSFILISGTPAADKVLGHFSLNTVPVPGAAWLFVSALLGVIGFKRRESRAS